MNNIIDKGKKKRKKSGKKKSKKKKKSKQIIYCGNNRLHPDVVSGRAIIGTKFRCLKKGYGAGFYSPVDVNFLNEYEPIDARRIYCGNKEQLPEGYDRHGNLPSCFQKGFATGKREKALRN
jgi:hypothetical protein